MTQRNDDNRPAGLEDVRLSTTQACQIMGVCRHTLYRWEARGLVRPFKLPDGARRYSLRELQALTDPKPTSS